MTKKNIRVLVAAYVLLAAAASAPFWLGGFARSVGWEEKSPIAFDAYDANADRFSIEGNGEALAFEKKDGAWEVNGKAADQKIIGTFFQVLQSTRVGRVVSRNAENRATYGVHEGDSHVLHVEQNGTSLDLLIGNAAPGQGAYYMRSANDDTVYEATGALRQLATRPESNWIPEQMDETATESPSSSET